jgi:hypothetical protein
VAVSCIGGGNQTIRRKPQTYRTSLTNFITYCCIEYTSPWAGFELPTLMVMGTDCTGSCICSKHTIKTTIPMIGKLTSFITIQTQSTNSHDGSQSTNWSWGLKNTLYLYIPSAWKQCPSIYSQYENNTHSCIVQNENNTHSCIVQNENNTHSCIVQNENNTHSCIVQFLVTR